MEMREQKETKRYALGVFLQILTYCGGILCSICQEANIYLPFYIQM